MEKRKMRAMIRTAYGRGDVITVRDIEKPALNENQVLIKVHATTVNRTDCANLEGKPWVMRLLLGIKRPKDQTTGTDFAGEIIEVGAHVKDFKVGDPVFGFNDQGFRSHAEYMVLESTQPIALMPEGLSYTEGVTALEGIHYARNFVNKVNLKSGQQVLINGASGAIGSALVQICNYLGAEVTGVCQEKHFDLMKKLGVKKMIDYTKQDFTKLNEDYDFVFDAVGKSSFGQCKALLKPKGVYISSELGKFVQNPFLSLVTPLFKGKAVAFPFPADIKGSIDFAKKMIKEDAFTPIIDRKYDLDDIEKAYDYVFSGQKTGNVVITFD